MHMGIPLTRFLSAFVIKMFFSAILYCKALA